MTFGDLREVVIVEYDLAWPSLFTAEKQRLIEVIGDAVANMHHVGSTSVPGLAAKPIIDVLILLDRFLTEAELDAVAAPGYEYRGEYGLPGRQYFSRRMPPAFHLHAYLADNPDAYGMLRFRDYLGAHPEMAREYESLKRRLAKEYRFARNSYQEAKTYFVRRVDALASSS